MKIKFIKKISSLFLCMMLIMAMAFCTTGCSDEKETPGSQNNISSEVTVLGEGKNQFAFQVVDKDGNQTNFEIHTDKTVVGEALFELELLEGETGDFGLFVKKVNGITADFDTDGVYWAFYINDEYAMTGVDETNIEEGATYTFKVEK